MTRPRLAGLAVAGAAALAAAGLGGFQVAQAASTSPVHQAAIFSCVAGNGNGPLTGQAFGHPISCPAGQIQVEVGAKPGPEGPSGPQGPQGPRGLQGPAGTNGTNGTAHAHDLGGVASVPTGGGFVANSTEVGTVTLQPGTYLLSLNAKAKANVATTAQVFPQFFVYNQVKNASFAGDLLNVGTGALEPFSTNHDSYYSGETLVTLASATTLHVYAFGYDSDSGGASYNLEDLVLTAVQVTAS